MAAVGRADEGNAPAAVQLALDFAADVLGIRALERIEVLLAVVLLLMVSNGVITIIIKVELSWAPTVFSNCALKSGAENESSKSSGLSGR